MERVTRWTIDVCGNCGANEIVGATEDDAKCGACGEWMNTEPIEVIPASTLDSIAEELEARADRIEKRNAPRLTEEQAGAVWAFRESVAALRDRRGGERSG